MPVCGMLRAVGGVAAAGGRGGSPDAANGVAALKKLMTAEDMTEAEKMAVTFKPVNPYASAAPVSAKP